LLSRHAGLVGWQLTAGSDHWGPGGPDKHSGR